MRLSIALFVAGLPFDGSTIYKASLGGAESAAVFLARELAKLKHRVFVFCGCPEPVKIDGVVYLPGESYGSFATRTPHDVSIVQRMPNVVTAARAAKVTILWQHDLAHVRTADVLTASMWAIDRVAVLSGYMVEQYKESIGLAESVMFRTRNGVDLELAAQAPAGTRDRRSTLYISRPERGLDVLLERVMPAILREVPDAKLHLCSYDNQVQHLAGFYGMVEQLVRGLGDRVEWHGHLSKPELYGLMKSCGSLVYPSPSPIMPEFAETSCITAMEAMACGLPVVASARGAIPETMGAAGQMLVPGTPSDEGHCEAIAAHAVRLMTDEPAWQAASDAGLARAAELSWAGVAAQWDAEIREIFAQVNDDPVRLARSFARRQDIEGAIKALDLAPDRADGMAYRRQLAETYAYAESEQSLAEYYGDLRQDDHEAWLQRVDESPSLFGEAPSRRFAMIADRINAAPDVGVVLDYGCAHGEGSIVYHNRTGRAIIGADISPHAIEWARKFRRFAKTPDAINFVAASHRQIAERLATQQRQVDCIVLGELLEHVLDPMDVIGTLQMVLKPGGLVIITMPWGPWETGYGNKPQHIREWTAADLQDVFGGQGDLLIDTVPCDENPHVGEPRGYTVCSFRANGTGFGSIDWSRKLTAQRPKQSLSVNLMCGGPAVEDTLHWCLRSVQAVADEVVIADCGMSHEARRIADQYGARIIPSSSPLDTGFEAPRNDALAASVGDWILWIDADEKLLHPLALNKYLRGNPLNGYGLKQHHFAADTQWRPDVPCRVFRRKPLDGRTMRFFGLIHEHPELTLNEGPGPVLIISDVEIAHVGYLNEEIRRKRFERNLPMLKRDMEKYPTRRLQKHLICREYMLLAKFHLEQNGGQLTPTIRALCEDTIHTYREHFIGNAIGPGFDTLQYYSAACKLLGLGFDVEFDIKAARDGIGDKVNGVAVRYASQEDFLKDIAARAKVATDRYESKWW